LKVYKDIIVDNGFLFKEETHDILTSVSIYADTQGQPIKTFTDLNLLTAYEQASCWVYDKTHGITR